MCAVSSEDISQDEGGSDQAAPAAAPPSEKEVAVLKAVEDAAERHWQALPDKPDMAVPVDREGVNAVRLALEAAATSAPHHPEINERLQTFERVVQWASSSRFAGTLATPIGAVMAAVIFIAFALDETRLPGSRDRLMLFAAALVLQALLFPSIARKAQVELNADFLAGTRSLDERFVRWLLSKGALLYTPIATARALLYGLLIPISSAGHMMRRGYFAAVAAILLVNIAVLGVAMNIADGLPKTPDDFDPGVDILGHWVPYDDPLSSIPEGATPLHDYGWHLRQGEDEEGVDASMYTKGRQLSVSHVKAWAPASAPDSNTYLSLYLRSAKRLESRWGAPTASRREHNDNKTCLTRWLTYQRGGAQLEVRDLACTTKKHRSYSRRISASRQDR